MGLRSRCSIGGGPTRACFLESRQSSEIARAICPHWQAAPGMPLSISRRTIQRESKHPPPSLKRESLGTPLSRRCRVYADQSKPHAEEWPLLERGPETPEADLYGARKARAEAIVRDRFGDRALIARAGMVVGPWDPTDRLTYWPRRVVSAGDVLAPGSPTDPVQFIDVRDLADWIVRATLAGECGVFNATGEPTTIGNVLETCLQVTCSSARLNWVPSKTLLAVGVDPWMGVPLWIAAPGWEAANRIDVGRAVAAGLTIRPLADVIRSSWEWDQQRRAAGEAPEMLTIEDERRILQATANFSVP
jgi:2'-hydroxyisoflavone reductase